METRPTREEAARTLGVSAAASPLDVKRAYRQRVRDHHPDAGGDPETFQRVQRAYERLSAVDRDAPPVVARGRPSRRPAPFTAAGDQLDLDAVDWTATPPADGEPLRLEALAIWLTPSPDGPLLPVRATSRAPGSRLNRVARHLATELTSTLSVTPLVPHDPSSGLTIEVVAATRRARRAVEQVGAEDGWVRRRGSSTTSLRSTVLPASTTRATALAAAHAVDTLLEQLGWPLHDWRADGSRPG